MSTTGAPVDRSLAASAVLEGQPQLGTSFRMHRPRGAFCQDGWCQQCKVQLDDGSVALACQVAGSARGRVASRAGLKRLLGLVAEHQPPWFHEARFLRPRFMRQAYLALLRRVSGALSLPDAAPPPGAAWRRLACDVLVVGGGVAGLGAARELRLSGRSVIVIDARPVDAIPLRAEVREAQAAAVDAGCTVLRGTLCVGLYEEPRRALCVDELGSLSVEHADLVVATGAYDRMLTFRNNDLPGIVGVRALEHLAAQGAIPAEARIGLYGEPAEIARALEALRAAGRAAQWVASPGPIPPGVGEIPGYPHAALVGAEGSRRIRGVRLSTAGRLACDLLVLGFSQPGYELQLQRGARLEAHGLPCKLVPDVEGTGLLVVGEAAGDSNPATAASDAARRAQQWLRTGSCPVSAAGTRYESCGAGHPDAFVCVCEDVRVRDVTKAIEDGHDDVELVKRRTGAATGPCQGKLCHASLVDCIAAHGLEVRLPTQRPLVRPVTFARFAGAPEE